ncbi:MAG TPA: LysE family translocator [Solirubrobacteraceae bacterium]|nr:LysE family translocator [Solirubrobacteraceae bacterium]
MVGSYWTFVTFAALLVVAPGPDFAVVVKNVLIGGRRRGAWASLGVTCSNAVQGTAAAVGLGAVIVRSQPLFEAIRWAGVGYLLYLGVQALRSARAGTQPQPGGRVDAPGSAARGWRQGFLSNITNPKVLVFYIAVLPQFLAPGAAIPAVAALAYTHAALSLAWLLLVVAALHRARGWLTRGPVRRALDAVTGCVLIGFGALLATERG